MGKVNKYEDELREMAGNQSGAKGGVPASTATTAKPTGTVTTVKTNNTKNPKGINPKGIVQPQYQQQTAATPAAETQQNEAPSVQETVQPTAQAEVQTSTQQTQQAAAAPATEAENNRTETAAYSESQQVQNALANLNAIIQGKPGEYNQSQTVIDAYNQLMNLQNGQPGNYTPSQNVLDAQAALQNLQTNKPQGYNNKYQPQLDALLQQIQNPGKFSWDFNGDELFKMYADEYTQRGKQASMDAMGQAAALTGGYGNSYAQQVGNQAYDQYLTQLYDRGMELRDKAYEQWLNEQQDLYNKYGLLNTAEQNDYNRYRDTVGDWRDERSYLADLYNTERNYDYNQYRDQMSDWMANRNYAADLYNTERNYDYNKYRDLMSDWMTNRDYATNQYNQLSNVDYSRYADARDFAEQQYQYDTSMNENVRQFNESLDWDKMSTEQKYNAEYAMQILANGEMPSEEILKAAGLSAEDAQKMIAKLNNNGSGTGGSGGKTYFVDKNGLYYTYDKDGNARPVSESDIKDTDYIDTSENKGTKGKEAEINEKYRNENDKLKKALKNRN